MEGEMEDTHERLTTSPTLDTMCGGWGDTVTLAPLTPPWNRYHFSIINYREWNSHNVGHWLWNFVSQLSLQSLVKNENCKIGLLSLNACFIHPPALIVFRYLSTVEYSKSTQKLEIISYLHSSNHSCWLIGLPACLKMFFCHVFWENSANFSSFLFCWNVRPELELLNPGR